jgi:hypothetical protein
MRGGSRGGEGGAQGKIISPAPLSSSSPMDSDSKGVATPSPRHCGSPGNTFESFFLFLHVLPFIFGAVGLPPRHILEKVDPPPASRYTHIQDSTP